MNSFINDLAHDHSAKYQHIIGVPTIHECDINIIEITCEWAYMSDK